MGLTRLVQRVCRVDAVAEGSRGLGFVRLI